MDENDATTQQIFCFLRANRTRKAWHTLSSDSPLSTPHKVLYEDNHQRPTEEAPTMTRTVPHRASFLADPSGI